MCIYFIESFYKFLRFRFFEGKIDLKLHLLKVDTDLAYLTTIEYILFMSLYVLISWEIAYFKKADFSTFLKQSRFI